MAVKTIAYNFNLKFLTLYLSNRLKLFPGKAKQKIYRILKKKWLKVIKLEHVKNLTQTNFTAIFPELIDKRRLRTKQDKDILISNLFPFVEIPNYKKYGFSLLLKTEDTKWDVNNIFSKKQINLFTLVITLVNDIYVVEKYGIYGDKSNKYLFFYHKAFNNALFIFNWYYMYNIYKKFIFYYDKNPYKNVHTIFLNMRTNFSTFWGQEKTFIKKLKNQRLIILVSNLYYLEYEKKKRLNKYKQLLYFIITLL